MDFAFTEQQEMIKKEVAALARSFSLDYWLEKDRKAEYPVEFIEAFKKNGWLGIVIPEEYGGSGLGVTEASILLHEICAAGAGTSGASPIHFYVFPPMPLIKHASEALKRRYLPRIAAGDIIMSFGVTEPNAGTDTSRIQTRAEKKERRWVINGRKVWNTNAQHATKILLLARTTPREQVAQKPFKGMTLFFADFDRSRITVREIEKLGRAAVDSNEIFIDNLEVPEEDVVGQVGEGFYHLLDSLNPERILTGIEAVGIGKAALERAVQYAKERVVFDRPIGKNQAIAHPLAQAWAKVETAELMCWKAAWLFDHGRPCGAEANTAKLMAAEAGFEACDVALQTFGGYGYAKEFYVERLWREIRLYKIAPVSQQMALNYLSEHVLGLPKSY
ncbi:MAG: acyl-CoA/acyl-ACP dehydrogenase [Candidatus Rokubacteria bacterium]|nr:acyl-CoA/acyl-ACP dehydrogenase [Candidatus Rokubacteria bacterium]MBI2555649.1 acyl-CoA/acyl-ACP dehydrogenase [Candidatus Rokubacteria bacterium]